MAGSRQVAKTLVKEKVKNNNVSQLRNALRTFSCI